MRDHARDPATETQLHKFNNMMFNQKNKKKSDKMDSNIDSNGKGYQPYDAKHFNPNYAASNDFAS